MRSGSFYLALDKCVLGYQKVNDLNFGVFKFSSGSSIWILFDLEKKMFLNETPDEVSEDIAQQFARMILM